MKSGASAPTVRAPPPARAGVPGEPAQAAAPAAPAAPGLEQVRSCRCGEALRSPRLKGAGRSGDRLSPATEGFVRAFIAAVESRRARGAARGLRLRTCTRYRGLVRRQRPGRRVADVRERRQTAVRVGVRVREPAGR